jgi:hypothetical protein
MRNGILREWEPITHPRKGQQSSMRLIDIGQDLDKLAAFGVAVLSVAFVVYGLATPDRNLFYIIIGVIALVSSILWLRVRDSSVLTELTPPNNQALFLGGNVLFFVFFGAALFSLHLRPDVYVRPLAYFVFAALMAGALAIEIVACGSKRRVLSLILVQIVIFGCMLQFSQLSIFPSVVGSDPWYHQLFAAQTIASGHVPPVSPFGNYANLPIFDLQVVSTSLLSSVDYKAAVMLSTELSQVIVGTLFIFLIGKSLMNAKVGLLGGLMLVTASVFIEMGSRTIPNTLGGTLFIVGLYVLLKVRDKSFGRTLGILLIFMVTVILTHTVSSVAMALAMLSGLIGLSLYRTLYRRQALTVLSPSLAIAFVIGMFAWWIYVSGDFSTLLARLSHLSFLESLPAGIIVTASPSSWARVLALSPFAFCIAALTGCFYMVSSKFGKLRTSLIVVMAVPALLLAVSGVGDFYLFQERWIYFAQILFAVPLGVTLLIAYRLARTRAKPFLLAGIVVLLSFVMLVSPLANTDSNLFGSASWVRESLTASQLHAIPAIDQKTSGDIIGDSYYIIATGYYYNNTNALKEKTTSGISSSNNVLVVREETKGSAYTLASLHATTKFALNDAYDPQLGNVTLLGSRIYDSGTVGAYRNSYLPAFLSQTGVSVKSTLG